MAKEVVFVHRVTCDYSEAFLVKVHERLKDYEIDFKVISGQPWEEEALIDVVSSLPFGYGCSNKKIGPFFWTHGVLAHIKNADLVIVEQLNSALHNYIILFFRYFKPKLWKKHKYKIGYYGHGLNLNSRSALYRNWFKKKMSLWVDWWFAYTELTKKIIYSKGYDNITVMNNTVDTTSLLNEKNKYSREDLSQFYKEIFNTDFHQPTAVFCARFVKIKWIPFLLQVLDIVKSKLPEFRMLMIGNGPYSNEVETFCMSRDWCKYVGPKGGVDKVKYLLLGDVWLNPGGVGLAIVDSFTLGLPLITVDNNIHGPEISYLENGVNGIITKPEVNNYANAIVDLFYNPVLLNSLKDGAFKSSKKYSIDNMVNNFVEGILRCLNSDTK